MNLELMYSTMDSKAGSTVRDIWHISRPMLTDDTVPSRSDIVSMNLPVSSFEVYTIRVKSSLLYRDLLLTFRPLVAAWCQSLRIAKFEYGELNQDPISYSKEAEDIINNCIKRVKDGEIQDYVKEDLPWSTETEYVISLDFRTFQNIVFTLLEHRVKYCDEWYEFFKKVTKLNDKDFANLNKADLYGLVSFNKEEKELPYGDNKGLIHALKANVLPNLAAQFVRMQTHVIKNELWNIVVEKGMESIEGKSMSTTPIDVLAYLDEASLNRIVSIRTCSFAQMDKESKGSWSSVLRPIVEKMTPQEFMLQLPCHGCKDKCVIQKDMEIKLVHKDENLPCAILLDNPYLINNRLDKFKSDSAIMMKWKSIKDLIKVDTSNKDNLTYHDDKYYPVNSDSTNNRYSFHKDNIWTSTFDIYADIPLDPKCEYKILSILKNLHDEYTMFGTRDKSQLNLDLIRENSVKFAMDPFYLSKVMNYDPSSKYFDPTCFMKGLALRLLHVYLYNKGSKSHLINFGGDILGYNTSVTARIGNSNHYIHKVNSTFCIFTSGNTEKRGNHIKGNENMLPEGSTLTIVVDSVADPAYYDALCTRMYAGYDMDSDIISNLIILDKDNKVVNRTYCASPFFNNKEIAIRDKMISNFTNVFRPDQTDTSKSYDVSPSEELAKSIYEDNVNNITDSEFLVFPLNTSDLGTLYEVGYAIRNDIQVIKYDVSKDEYYYIDMNYINIELSKVTPDEDSVIDVSNPGGAVLIGYNYDVKTNYDVKDLNDNIMLSINYTRVEKVGDSYKVLPKKFKVGM